jgi:TPR repeat protein
MWQRRNLGMAVISSQAMVFTPIEMKHSDISNQHPIRISQSHPSIMAFWLEDGMGVRVDLIESADHHKMPADQNIAEPQFNFGLCLQHGKTLPVDMTQAV